MYISSHVTSCGYKYIAGENIIEVNFTWVPSPHTSHILEFCAIMAIRFGSVRVVYADFGFIPAYSFGPIMTQSWTLHWQKTKNPTSLHKCHSWLLSTNRLWISKMPNWLKIKSYPQTPLWNHTKSLVKGYPNPWQPSQTEGGEIMSAPVTSWLQP